MQMNSMNRFRKGQIDESRIKDQVNRIESIEMESIIMRSTGIESIEMESTRNRSSLRNSRTKSNETNHRQTRTFSIISVQPNPNERVFRSVLLNLILMISKQS